MNYIYQVIPDGIFFPRLWEMVTFSPAISIAANLKNIYPCHQVKLKFIEFSSISAEFSSKQSIAPNYKSQNFKQPEFVRIFKCFHQILVWAGGCSISGQKQINTKKKLAIVDNNIYIWYYDITKKTPTTLNAMVWISENNKSSTLLSSEN